MDAVIERSPSRRAGATPRALSAAPRTLLLRRNRALFRCPRGRRARRCRRVERAGGVEAHATAHEVLGAVGRHSAVLRTVARGPVAQHSSRLLAVLVRLVLRGYLAVLAVSSEGRILVRPSGTIRERSLR